MADKAKKKKPTNKIDIGANLTIEQVKKIHNQYLSKVKKKPEILVFSKQLETIDLAGIQFLLHIKSKAKKEGLNLVLDCNPIDAVNEILEKSGFFKLFEN
jgi:anti-anti-sigma regulatory factor